MIVDAHVHAYTWPTVKKENPQSSSEFRNLLTRRKGEAYFKLFKEDPIDMSDALVESMDRNGISKAVVMSSVWRVPNDFMAKIVMKHKDRLIGFCRWLPGAQGEEAARQIDEAVKKYGFCGIGEEALSEFYPVPPYELHRNREFRIIMDKIEQLNVPILFDSGLSTAPRPLSYYEPLIVDSIANDYTDIPMILGHSGKSEPYFFNQALMAARRKNNIYLELSYQPTENIEKAVELVGADRCMFGTDWPRYLPNPPRNLVRDQIQLVMSANISEEEHDQIMGKTIVKVLGI